MKKMLLLTAAVLFLATGCSTTNTQKTTSNLQDTNKNNSSESVSDKTPVPTKKKLTKKEKYERYAKKVKVKVYDKKNLPIDFNAGRYSPFIEFDYKVINKSPKAVKGIKGILHIYDQFDDKILSLNWDVSVGVIKSGKTKKVTKYGLDYNQFIDTHNKIYNLEYEDIIFKYEIQQINFSDGYKLKL